MLPENIDPLVPVLRNNYWLTIHVLTITLSYAAFALAMGFGHIVLFRYLRESARQAVEDKQMHFWLYRVLQLGVLLLAAGTILGGVWANYSWGRFWGWDPKETWALITLLCYIVVLHGRLAGWWRDFGLAVGSVVCFLSVVMAWYGVNFVLGTGLHSYGFGIGGESYVMTAVALDFIYVTVAAFRYLWRAETQPGITRREVGRLAARDRKNMKRLPPPARLRDSRVCRRACRGRSRRFLRCAPMRHHPPRTSTPTRKTRLTTRIPARRRSRCRRRFTPCRPARRPIMNRSASQSSTSPTRR